MNTDELKRYVREVPDFPKPGINFYDISTLMSHAVAFQMAVDQLSWKYIEHTVDKVVGMESRGFIFAPIMASRLNAGFVPVRKPGKLPSKTISRSYALEYGKDSLEMHSDGIAPGEKVLIIDDLIATGGTAAATVGLVEEAGGIVVGLGFVIELKGLNGRALLERYDVQSLLVY